MPCLEANYPSSTLEEIGNRNLEIIKIKKSTLFLQFATNVQEFKEGYEKGEKVNISLIPRKSDGKVD